MRRPHQARNSEMSGDDMLKRWGTFRSRISRERSGIRDHGRRAGPAHGTCGQKAARSDPEEMLFDPLGMQRRSFACRLTRAGRVADPLASDPSRATCSSLMRSTSARARRATSEGEQDWLVRPRTISVRADDRQWRRAQRAAIFVEKTVRFMLSNHTAGMGGTTIATTGPDTALALAGACGLDEGMGYARAPRAMRVGRRLGHQLSGSIPKKDSSAS